MNNNVMPAVRVEWIVNGERTVRYEHPGVLVGRKEFVVDDVERDAWDNVLTVGNVRLCDVLSTLDVAL